MRHVDSTPMMSDMNVAASSLSGRLLIAMPGISDPRFEHAVILICIHDETQTMGLRLDNPANGHDLVSVLGKLDLPATEVTHGRSVLLGGPVDRERGFVLHTDDWMSNPDSLAFGYGLAITATREALKSMTDPIGGPRRSTLMLGYAGWGAGQIEEELAENVWLTVEADMDLIFDDHYETKWTRALARLGVDAAMLSAQGGHA